MLDGQAAWAEAPGSPVVPDRPSAYASVTRVLPAVVVLW
jgi:hypothetical protein